MKIIQKKSLFGGKKAVIGVLLVLAIAAGVTGAYVWKMNASKKSLAGPATQSAQATSNVNSLAPATDEQKAAGDRQKSASADANIQGQSTTSNNDTLAVTITSFTQSDSQIQLRTLINTITNDGTCTLTVQSGSASVTKTSGIQAMPSSSTCKGFTLASDELPAGDWSATLSVTSGTKTGAVTKDLQVQ